MRRNYVFVLPWLTSPSLHTPNSLNDCYPIHDERVDRSFTLGINDRLDRAGGDPRHGSCAVPAHRCVVRHREARLLASPSQRKHPGRIGVSKAWLKCYVSPDRPMLEHAVRVLAASGIESSQRAASGTRPRARASARRQRRGDPLAGGHDATCHGAGGGAHGNRALRRSDVAIDERGRSGRDLSGDVCRPTPKTSPHASIACIRSAAVMRSPALQRQVVGASAPWQNTVRELVEVGAFTNASVLIEGESGTGKELLAQLVHDLDRASAEGRLRHPRLRRDHARAVGQRVLRSRARRVHGRGECAGRRVCAGERRHAVPRRGR